MEAKEERKNSPHASSKPIDTTAEGEAVAKAAAVDRTLKSFRKQFEEVCVVGDVKWGMSK